MEKTHNRTATKDDIENTQAWVELVGDMLWLARCKPVVVLEKALEAARKKGDDDSHLGVRIMSVADLRDKSFGEWNARKRLKALVVQVFVRDIANNHSREEAADLLFGAQRYGTGSGCLGDYLENLEGHYHG
jgi:hypothetical protein